MSKVTNYYSNNLPPKSYQFPTSSKVPDNLTQLKSFVELFSTEAKKSKQKGETLKVKRSSDILKFVISRVDEIFRSGFSAKTLCSLNPEFEEHIRGSGLDASVEDSVHYYEMVTFYLVEKRKSVEFTNKQEYLKSARERADIWILLEFNLHNLDLIFELLHSYKEIKEMYTVNKGISAIYHKELLETLKMLKEVEFFIDSEVIRGYENYSSEKIHLHKEKTVGEINSAGLKEKNLGGVKKENSENLLNNSSSNRTPEYLDALDPNDPIYIWNMKKNKTTEKPHASRFASDLVQKQGSQLNNSGLNLKR